MSSPDRVPASFFSSCFQRLPFGVGQSEGRDRDRYMRAVRSMAFNVVSTALGLASVLLSVSFTLPYLGQERFGIWMTISSLAVMLSVLDFGVANGLVNFVATAKASDDHERLRTMVTRGLALLALIGLVAGVVLIGCMFLFDFSRVIKTVSASVQKEASLATVVFIALFCINIPLGGVRKVFQGLQRAWEPHLASSLGYFVSIPLLYLCARHHASIPLLVCATYGMQQLATLILLVRLQREKLIGTRPDLFSADGRRDCRLLAGRGGVFLFLQIGLMCGTAGDPLFVSHILGAKEVARLAVAQRLFQCIGVAMAMLTAPLWGLYADARSRGETPFIRKTLKLSLSVTTVAACAMSGLILALSSMLLRVWTGTQLDVPIGLRCAIAVLVVIEAVGNAFSIFLNGVGELDSQLVSVLFFCVSAVALKIFLLTHFGTVEWVVWSTVIASLLTWMVYVGLYRKQIFAHVSPVAGPQEASPAA
jgi:O-antigen/teichoic acid export membrane protein